MTQESSLSVLRGRYQIRQRLGVGGMGAVYLAEDRNLAGKLVAVKQNKETLPEIQRQFNREAVLLANLNHPALPAVTDYFIESDGRQFLVMDYIAGKDLWEIFQENDGPLPEATVLGWIATILDALDYLHNYVDPATQQPRPIIHRDVKPANIKLKTNGQIYLVDFGLAKIAESGVTHPGSHGFTAGFSPLEQYGGKTSTRSDMYALGATLYVLLTGETPLGAPALLSGEASTAPRQLNPHITANTEQVILRAMALRPEDRFQTVAEMRSALFPQPAQPTRSTQRIDDHDSVTTVHPLIGPLNKPTWHSGLAWLLVAVAVFLGLTIPIYITGLAGLTSVFGKLFEVGGNFYAGVQAWLSIWWSRLVSLAIIVAIVISRRSTLGTIASQALHLSLRHFVRILVLLLPFSIGFSLIASPVDLRTVAFLKRQSIIIGWISWLTYAWVWFLVGFCVPGIIVARRAVVAVAARKQETEYGSKATLAPSPQLVTRPLQIATPLLSTVISAARSLVSAPVTKDLELQGPEIDVVESNDLTNLTNLIRKQKKSRILLTGYGRFGGTVLVREAMRQAISNDPWLIINFSVMEHSPKKLEKGVFADFKIYVNKLDLGILSAHISENPEQAETLQGHAKLVEHASDIASGRRVYHIALQNKVINGGFFKLPVLNDKTFDLNKFLVDLNKAITEGKRTRYLQQAVARLTRNKTMPTRVVFVFDKIDRLEILQTVSKLFENENISVIVVARKEHVDQWKNCEQHLNDMKFYEQYVACKWRKENESYVKTVVQKRLPNKEVPESQPYKSHFLMLCKHIGYVSRGIPGEIHHEINNNPRYYPTKEGHIVLESLADLEQIKDIAELQDLLDLNWKIITAGMFKQGNRKTKTEEDRARLGVSYLLDWIHGRTEFTRYDLLSAIANPSKEIPILISDQPVVIDKIVESLLWVLIQHNYLAEKDEHYYRPAAKSIIRKPRKVIHPVLKSLGLVKFMEAARAPIPNDGEELKPSEEKVKNILFISANPKGGQEIPRREEKVIADLGQKQNKVSIRITKNIVSARVSDIREALDEEAYHIVHISAHSSLGNLVMEDLEGNPVPVSQRGLAELFAKGKSIECVVLSVCESLDQGELIAQHIPYTIAMDQKISVDAAIEFTREFYSAIGQGKDYQTAFAQSCANIRLRYLLASEADKPKFINKVDKSVSSLSET